MELSELTGFNGRLLTPDDRTGIVYDVLHDGKVLPWAMLTVHENDPSPMKAEWATVKEQGSKRILYMGGNGKEFCKKISMAPSPEAFISRFDMDGDKALSKREMGQIKDFFDRFITNLKDKEKKMDPFALMDHDSDGLISNQEYKRFVALKGATSLQRKQNSLPLICGDKRPLWVAKIDGNGVVSHENWEGNYGKLRKAAGLQGPGWMLHEAVLWSKEAQRWIFTPRRASTEAYAAKMARTAGSNLMLLASEDFSDIVVRKIGVIDGKKGFSSLCFVPGTREKHLIGLKSVEDVDEAGKPVIESWLGVYDIYGAVVMEEVKLPWNDFKFEGVEFLDRKATTQGAQGFQMEDFDIDPVD